MSFAKLLISSDSSSPIKPHCDAICTDEASDLMQYNCMLPYLSPLFIATLKFNVIGWVLDIAYFLNLSISVERLVYFGP